MWGGRFATGPDAIMARINASVDSDVRLVEHDIVGSQAHAAMLGAAGVIPRADADAIIAGLAKILEEWRVGAFTLDPALEDVHLNVENRLKTLIGPAAGRLHTARSRNDQVVTDIRLWTRDALDRSQAAVKVLQQALVVQAEAQAATVMPGFTHLQSAQPVTFGHHLLAYVEMLDRDRGRLADARKRGNENPLGAAALAGTSYPIDRKATAKALRFDRPMRNSLDAVSSRDFAIEAVGAAAICASHLSRLAEEIVLWTSPMFGFARLSDRYSTGSSIMPQKRNPDAAELVRAKAGVIAGALQTLLMVIKGLPLAYSKDLQDMKPPLFAAFDDLELSLAAMTGMIGDLAVDKDAMGAAAGAAYATATDLADWLVAKLGLPFREAHHVTGAIVAEAERRSLPLHALPLEAMKAVEPRITADALALLTPAASVASRKSEGGTAPVRVAEQVAAWKERLA
jgi:argininosuccinate lyase